MNIVIINQYALPKGEAGITRHGDIGAELVARGHRVTVIASDFDYFTRRQGARPRESERDGVRFIWLRSGAYVQNDRRRVRSMVRFAAGAGWAAGRQRPRPDVIVGSSPHLLAPLSAESAARMLRRPWVFEVRDFWPSALVDLGAIRAGGRTHRTLERLERHLYRSAASIVSVPPRGDLRLEELGEDAGKVVHIPNSTTMASVAPSDPPASLRRVLVDLKSTFLLVYAGALGVTHDLETVLLALAELDRAPRSARPVGVLFLGDGVERERTEATASRLQLPNVRFHPAVEKRAIPWVLAQADACLMHAGGSDYFKYGLSPNKMFDYFSSGKPVLIAADHPTVVDEDRVGVRYSPGKPAALADAVRRVMGLSAEELHAITQRATSLAAGRYSVSAIATQYETLLREVVARSRR
jgi:glycosyltransferase involved in cell wall biosynthesis